MIVEVYERRQSATDAVKALKDDVSEMRKEDDHLNSTNFNFLFGTVKIPDDPSVDVPTCGEVSPTPTRDQNRDDVIVAESETNTDKEKLGDHEEVVYEDMAVLEVYVQDN